MLSCANVFQLILRNGRSRGIQHTVAPWMLTVALIVPASAQYPIGHLRAIQPPVFQIGQATDTRLVGSDLVAVDRLWFSVPQMEATVQSRAAKPFAAEAQEPDFGHFSVVANAKPGIYEVRAVGANGASNPLRFIATDQPVVIMPGDASTREKAQAATIPGWIAGTVRASGFAYVSMKLESKEPIVIDAFARRIDSSSELEIEVQDESGRRLLRAQADPTREDPLIVFTPPAPGTYYLAIADHLFAGGDNAFFAIKLHQGSMVRWVQPVVVKRGQDASVRLFGLGLAGADGQTGAWQAVDQTIPAAEVVGSGSILVRPPGASVDGMSSDLLRPDDQYVSLTDSDVVLEQEPNDQFGQAQAVPIDHEVSGIFGEGRDADWYRFDVKKDQSYDLSVFSNRLGFNCDPVLGVFRVDEAADGSKNVVQVALFDDHADRAKQVNDPFRRSSVDPSGTFKADRDGTFYIRVGDHFSVLRDDPPIQYRLAIATPAPALRAYALVKQLRVDNANQYPSTSLSIRKGETIDLTVEVDRFNFNEPIQIEAAGLPESVKAPNVTIPAGSTSATLLLTASADASFEPTPISVKATGNIGDKTVTAQAVPIVCVIASGNVTTDPASCRTTSTLMLSQAADEAHASVSLQIPEAMPQAKPGETHTVKFDVTRRREFNAPLKFKALGLAGNWKVPEVTIDEKTARESTRSRFPRMPSQDSTRFIFDPTRRSKCYPMPPPI
ncbi:MAG: PPC domain-containing protein [Pirellulaceae bacterium]